MDSDGLGWAGGRENSDGIVCSRDRYGRQSRLKTLLDLMAEAVATAFVFCQARRERGGGVREGGREGGREGERERERDCM